MTAKYESTWTQLCNLILGLWLGSIGDTLVDSLHEGAISSFPKEMLPGDITPVVYGLGLDPQCALVELTSLRIGQVGVESDQELMNHSVPGGVKT